MRRAVQFLFIVVFLMFMSGCGSQSPGRHDPGNQFELSQCTGQLVDHRHTTQWGDGSVLSTDHHRSHSDEFIRVDRFAFEQHELDPR